MTAERDLVVKYLRELARRHADGQQYTKAEALYKTANEIKHGRHIPKKTRSSELAAKADHRDELVRAADGRASIDRSGDGELIIRPGYGGDDSIELVTGDKLDRWGWTLDVPRLPGEADEQYRAALIASCRWEYDSVEEWEAGKQRALDRTVKS